MVIGRKSVYDLYSSRWHFQRVERLNRRWVHSKLQWACTAHINMVIFYPVGLLLQLMQLNCVQHQSAFELIHLRSPGDSTFVFWYYSLGGDTSMLGRLYVGLCHSFLVIIMVPWTHSTLPQRHIDQFSRFCRAHPHDRQTKYRLRQYWQEWDWEIMDLREFAVPNVTADPSTATVGTVTIIMLHALYLLNGSRDAFWNQLLPSSNHCIFASNILNSDRILVSGSSPPFHHKVVYTVWPRV